MCEINGNQHPIGKVAEHLSISSRCTYPRTPIVLSFLLEREKRVFLYSHVAACERTMNIQFAPNTLYYGDCLDVTADLENRYTNLICLAPPFSSAEKYNKVFEDSGLLIDPQIKAFDDVWLQEETCLPHKPPSRHNPVGRSYPARCAISLLCNITY